MRRFWVGMLVAIVACGESSTRPSVKVATIRLNESALQLQTGQTLQLTAKLLDANGTKLTQTVAWSTSNRATVTVSSTGLLAAVAAGSATVTASAGGQSASVELTVFDAGRFDCAASATTTLNLPVGGVQLLSSAQAFGCLKLPASVLPEDYVFIAANAGSIPDVRETYAVTSSSVAASVASAMGASSAVRSEVLDVARAGVAGSSIGAYANPAERRFRLAERTLNIVAARTNSAASTNVRRSVASGAAIPRVGDLLPYRVPKRAGDACTEYDSLTAVVKAIGDHGILVQDTAAFSTAAGGFADADFTAMSREFDNLIYATDTSYFGSPSDLDVNQRVIILFTPRVNAYTKGGSGGYTAGFFFGGDLFPRTGAADEACKESNVGEIFYVIAPDPTGVFGQGWPATKGAGFAHPIAQVRQGTRGTIAHEFQHMINLGRRINDPLAIGFEATWLDEALAHFAEEAVGRAARGYGDLQNLTINDVTVDRNDYEAFFGQNLVRFQTWMQQPDTSSATSEFTASELAYRGAAWSLLRYTADQYSAGDVRAFTKRLAGGPDTSVANLVARAGVPFDSLMVGWLVANYADDLPGLAGLDPKYTYRSYNMRSVMAGVSSNVFPLKVSALPTAPQPLALRAGTGAYFRLNATSAPAVLFQLLAPGGSRLVTTPGARLYVLRVR